MYYPDYMWGRISIFDNSGMLLAESQVGNRFTFQGREYPYATGLYNFRARYYDPITGRWLSKDPIGISGGLNQYEAFANNPVNFIDPLGFEPEQSTDNQNFNLSFRDINRLAADAWEKWVEWSDPVNGYWNLQGNIPLGGPFGLAVAGIYDAKGPFLGVGVYLGTPGVSLTRGLNQSITPNSHNVSGQVSIGLAGELGGAWGGSSPQKIYGESSGFGEVGIGLPGGSANYLYIPQF